MLISALPANSFLLSQVKVRKWFLFGVSRFIMPSFGASEIGHPLHHAGYGTSLFGADNAIKLPITEACFCIDNFGPVRNVNATWGQATHLRCGIILIAVFATSPQIQIKCSARVFVRPDVPIKASITDFCAVFVVECTTDLLRTRLIVVQ